MSAARQGRGGRAADDGRAGNAHDFGEAELAPLRALRSRYLGALHGLAACDALAAATQFRRPGSFAPVGDLLGGGPFDLPRGAWSDDTAMALCLAESLLERGDCDPADQRERYRRWQREGYLSAAGQCLGITAATAHALAGDGEAARAPAGAPAARATAAPPGAAAPGPAPGEPLSRLLPLVLRGWPAPARLQEWAVASARVTSDSRITHDAARVLVQMLRRALLGAPPARVLRHEPDLYAADPLCAPVEKLAASSALDRPGPQGSQALDVLALARWCFASTTGFRGGALQAANLGGDSDMVCAVYGQLAGLHHGYAAIPRGWRLAVAQPELLGDIADRLLREALLAFEQAGHDEPAADAATAPLAAGGGA